MRSATTSQVTTKKPPYEQLMPSNDRAGILLKFPQIGYQYSERQDIRVLLYGHYRIAYLLTPEKNIEILGVFHGALDMARYLTPHE